MPREGARRRGFTLLEVLMAVAIGGSLVTVAMMFAFSMGELWGSGSEQRLFDQHVRGVSRFLDNIMRQAIAPPPEPGANTNPQAEERQGQTAEQMAATRASQSPVVWQRARAREYGTEQFLTFELPESPGVFPWPSQPLPFVVCALRVDPNEGLFILWKSRLEIDFEDEAPRELLVSPFVTGVTYFYYDTSSRTPVWEEREQPRIATGGAREVPTRVRFIFEYGGLKRTADLVLPGTPASVPLY